MATKITNDDSDVTLRSLPDPCEDAKTLAAKAERCRRLAAGISDPHTASILTDMAIHYERAARQLTDRG